MTRTDLPKINEKIDSMFVSSGYVQMREGQDYKLKHGYLCLSKKTCDIMMVQSDFGKGSR